MNQDNSLYDFCQFFDASEGSWSMMTGQESLYQAGTYPITIIGYVEGYEAEA